jgi:hypothetical protein
MATVYLSPIGNGFQFFTSGGLVLNGGFLNTYAAGSTTPTATYTTNIGNVQNANPIQLNSDGRTPSEIWLIASQSYKFELTDSLGNSIATYDNLYGIGDPSAPISADSTAAALGFIPVTSVAGTANAITGAIPATVTAYAIRQVFRIVPSTQNTGATAIVLTPSGSSALTSRNIFLNGQALTGGEIRAGIPLLLEDDGTQLNIVGNGYMVAGVSAASVTSAATLNLDNLTGDYASVLGTTAITAVTLAPGRVRSLEFAASLGISSNPSILGFVSQTTITTIAGDTAIVRGEASSIVRVLAFARGNGMSFMPPRSYLAGCALSTAGGSATMSIAAGSATESTNTIMLALVSGLAKTTGSWSVGTAAGGLDTGVIANATWYHFFLIMRPDTGVVDVLCSLSATAPTMPANYIFKRRIGAGLTDGSAHWLLFSQNGDEFLWSASILDVNANNPGTGAVSRTLSVPTGVKVMAVVNWQPTNASNAVSFGIYVSSLDQADEAASLTAAPLTNNLAAIAIAAGNAANGGDQITTRTSTSAQVRTRALASDANCTLRAATLGWFDRRGRDD